MALPVRCANEGYRGKFAFSLVEVTIALGVIAFVLISVFGLLSVGLASNRVSLQETRATGILTLLESDLRNSHPESATSTIYGFPLPYVTSGSEVIVNPLLAEGSVFSVGLDDAEQVVSLTATPRPPFQASVVYTQIPLAGSRVPVRSQLIVSWPSTNTTDPLNLTRNVSGFVEAPSAFSPP